MRSEQQFNLQSPLTDKTPVQDIRQVTDEIARLSESVEHIRSDVMQTWEEMNAHVDAYESHVRRMRVLWGVVIGLTISLVSVAWFGYSLIREQRALLDQVDFQNVKSAGDRTIAVKPQPNFSTERNNLQSAPAVAQQQAQGSSGQFGQSGTNETNQDAAGTPGDIGDAKARQNQVQDRQSAIQEKNDLRNQSSEVPAARSQPVQRPGQPQQETKNRSSAVDRPAVSAPSKAESSAPALEGRRVDFAVPTNRTEQVISGIYLKVSRADTGQQKVDGVLQIASESRILNIRDQRALEPMTFYTRRDNKTLQLVFTRIARNEVAGYVVVPQTPGVSDK
jgi:hypothetical protein